MRKLLLVMIAVFVWQNVAFAQTATLMKHKDNRCYPLLYLSMGYPCGVQAPDFFEDYQTLLNSKVHSFKNSPLFGAGVKFWIADDFRLGAASQYLNSEFFDELDTLSGSAAKHFSEAVSVKSIPVFVTLDYTPYDKQFRNYVGVGAGLLISRITWEEGVSPITPSSKRVGGKHYNQTDLSPAFEIYTGVELGFDEDPSRKFFGSLILEANYTLFFRDADIFKNIKSQLHSVPDGIEDNQSLINGYLGLSVGLSFNLRGEY